jgi:hypothetical protein
MRSIKSPRYLLLGFAATVCLLGGAVASAQGLDINVFVNELSPYGQWVSTPQFGQAWIPRDMPMGWRPYTDGRWVWTDQFGWTWVSNYDWGWAPFHYGRWTQDARYGWMWIPGTEWAPAWVAWRRDSNHVGWAPLPPQVRWRGGSPMRLSNRDLDDYIGRDWWNFVDRQRFVASDVRQYLLPTATVVSLLPVSRNVTFYEPRRSGIANRSIDLPFIEQVVGSRVPRVRVERVQSFDDYRARHRDADNFYIYEPRGRAKDRSEPIVTERERRPSERTSTNLVQVPVERTQRPHERSDMRGRPHVNLPPPSMGDYRSQTRSRGETRMKGRTSPEPGIPMQMPRDTSPRMKDRGVEHRAPVDMDRGASPRMKDRGVERRAPVDMDRGASPRMKDRGVEHSSPVDMDHGRGSTGPQKANPGQGNGRMKGGNGNGRGNR